MSKGIVHVAVEGDKLDCYNVALFREQAVEAAENGCHKVVLDLSLVEYIDDHGLAVLVCIKRICKRMEKDLLLVVSSECVRVLEILGLHHFFADNLETAPA